MSFDRSQGAILNRYRLDPGGLIVLTWLLMLQKVKGLDTPTCMNPLAPADQYTSLYSHIPPNPRTHPGGRGRGLVEIPNVCDFPTIPENSLQ